MADWKKVDLTEPPFFFSGESDDRDYLTGEYAAVFNKAVQKELGGKNLEYLWAEEGNEEPDYLENFECGGWEPVFIVNAQNCSHFGYVTLAHGPPLKGVGWVINFEMLSPIWIREV